VVGDVGESAREALIVSVARGSGRRGLGHRRIWYAEHPQESDRLRSRGREQPMRVLTIPFGELEVSLLAARLASHARSHRNRGAGSRDHPWRTVQSSPMT